MIKVTFDTNTFDKAARPHVYAKDPDHGSFVKVHEGVKDGRVKGFLSDPIVTLEGIKVDDRADVFGSTALASRITEEGCDTIHVNLRTEQPLRSPLHPKQAERLGAALALGDEVSRNAACRQAASGGAQRRPLHPGDRERTNRSPGPLRHIGEGD
jgi:hypothetical protein